MTIVDKNFLYRVPILIAFFFISNMAFSQNGSIEGIVIKAETGDPITDAEVFIPGSVYSSYSEDGGVFLIEDVPPGTYEVHVEDYIDGDTAIFKNVIVKAGEPTVIEIKVGDTFLEDEAVTITIHVEENTESQTTNVMKEETKVVNLVSSEEMNKKGDSKASDAAKRVSGVTVEGGKYVYVRGLSDRYSKTILNGAEIPGLDPNRNSVQLDMFPSAFLQNIKIIKTFSPDLPGDFTGGLVDISTRDYPNKFQMKLSQSMGYNPQAHFRNDFISGNSSKTDFLGFDNGERDVPALTKQLIETGSMPFLGQALFDNTNAETLDAVMKEQGKQMAPAPTSSFMNYSTTFTIGNKVKIRQKKDTNGVRTFGYFGGLSYKKTSNMYNDYVVGRYQLTGTVDERDALDPNRVFNGTKSSENVLLGGFLSLDYAFNPENKIGLNLLRNQTGSGTAAELSGINEDDFAMTYRNFNVNYQERSMNSAQLRGAHQLKKLFFVKNKVDVDWHGAYTLSVQNTPDLRWFNDNFFVQNDTNVYEIRAAAYRTPARFWREMDQFNTDHKLHVSIPVYKDEFEDTLKYKVKFGGSHTYKSRTFTETRLEFAQNDATYNGDPNSYFNDVNTGFIGESGSLNLFGVTPVDFSTPTNNYTATQSVIAGYAMIEKPLSQKMDFVGGARFEYTNILLESENPAIEKGELLNADVLPSVNLIYKIQEGARRRTMGGSNEIKVAALQSDYETFVATEVGKANLKKQKVLKKISKTKNEIGDLKAELEELDPEKEKDKKRLDKLNEELAEQGADLDSLGAELASINVDSAKISARKKELDFKIKDLNNDIAADSLRLVKEIESLTQSIEVEQDTNKKEKLQSDLREANRDLAIVRSILADTTYVKNELIDLMKIQDSLSVDTNSKDYLNISRKVAYKTVELRDLLGNKVYPDLRYQDQKIRFSWTRTLARPNFREIAPFTNEKYDLGIIEKGNPLIERTLVDNFDLRWEVYPRLGEIISVAAFFKSFSNPIQKVIVPNASNTEMTWINSVNENGGPRSASLYGAEFEFRKNLRFINPTWKNFNLATNLTVVQSLVNVVPTELNQIHVTDPYHDNVRPLFGSSPYITNASLFYNNDSSGLSANLTFNVFGRRLSLINAAGTPNIYEMPRPALDFTVGKKFGRLSIKLRFKNLLNPEWRWKYLFVGNASQYDKFDSQNYYFKKFRVGRTYSISISYNFSK